MFYRVFIAVALSLGVVGMAQAQAVNITPLMENECQWDYHNFCGQYAIGSELLDGTACRGAGSRSRRRRARSQTPGPVIRQWVSRHSVAYGAPML